MKKISIADMTLRECSAHSSSSLSFKEKIEIAKRLDKLNVSIIEMPFISDEKIDSLLIRTIGSLMKNSIVSCPVGLSAKEADIMWNAVSGASKPRLHVIVPTSTVQMEYICHKKPAKVLELIETVVKHCAALCPDVEFTADDATRSEKEFLYQAVSAAICAGAKTVTLCDSVGTMLPEEVNDFVEDVKRSVPEMETVDFAIQCKNELHMATACAIATIKAGATVVKTAIDADMSPALGEVAHAIRIKGTDIGVETNLNVTELQRAIKQMAMVINSKHREKAAIGSLYSDQDTMVLDSETDIEALKKAVIKLGYDLSEDDMAKVYDAFSGIVSKKQVGSKELEAIIASTALQTPPTYKLVSYVINCGNVITATAHITLEKNGETLQGFSIGDGPIDASFLAIEQIIGHHYELDDFQIQAVTEGRGAVGDALVKLRENGKLFSGRGISTDIIGASIHAYINALNKIAGLE